MRHFREEDGFDPSWGRCCCYYGNRRGSRCVFAFDLVFIAHLIRFLCSWYACWKRKDPQRLAYKRYAKWRRWTFWIQAPLILAGLVGFIMDDVLNRGGLNYVISVFATIMVAFILYIDYHWSSVVYFNANFPWVNKKPIDWLASDSEP